MIRLPDIAAQPSTGINMPGVSASAIGAQAAGIGDLGKALMGVSDQFTETALRLQKVANARQISEKRFALAESYAEHRNELQKDPDPVSRMEKTRAFLQQAKSMVDGEDMPEAVRLELGNHFENFASNAVILQSEDSARLEVSRAKAAFQNEITAATRNQDRAGLEVALSTAESAGVLLPEEKEPFIADFERTVTGTQFDAALEEMPEEVLKDIERPDFSARFPGMTPEDVPRLRSAARSNIQRKRGEEMDIIEAALMTGNLSGADIEAARYLTDEDRVRVSAALSETEPPDTSKHSQVWDALFKLRKDFKNPAVTDEQYAEKWNETRSGILGLLPPAFQGDLKQELSYRSPANRLQGQPDARPDALAKDYALLATARIKKAFDEGSLGDVTDPKSEAAKKAYTRMEDTRAATIQFIKQNPNATWPEVRDFTAKALGTSLDDGEDVPIVPAAPAPVSFDTRLNGLLGIPDGSGDFSNYLLPPPP
jgi:hypothetical protein